MAQHLLGSPFNGDVEVLAIPATASPGESHIPCRWLLEEDPASSK
jgi:hypothetical protein